MNYEEMEGAHSVRIRHSPEINELATALSSAQAEMQGAKKDSMNPHFKNMYADLESVWDACRMPLSKYGLAVLQPVLAHKSGQWFASDLEMTSQQNTPQGIGSTITYGRRYGLSAMVGIAPEDDDGQQGSQRDLNQERAAVLDRKLEGGDRCLDEARASGVVVQKMKPGEVKRMRPVAKDAAVPPEVEKMLSRMTDKFSALAVFAELKNRYAQRFGETEGHAKYYTKLGHFEAKKSSDFKGLGTAQKCAVEMQTELMESESLTGALQASLDMLKKPSTAYQD
jgi:hypothetical protein